MVKSTTTSLVQEYKSMAPQDFGKSIESKWQAAERLVLNVRADVEEEQLTPLEGARRISSIAATVFGYDEFVLNGIVPEMVLSAAAERHH